MINNVGDIRYAVFTDSIKEVKINYKDNYNIYNCSDVEFGDGGYMCSEKDLFPSLKEAQQYFLRLKLS